MASPEIEETLAQVWQELCLSDTLPPLSFDQTITRQQLQTLQGGDRRLPPQQGRAFWHSLPRIDIDPQEVGPAAVGLSADFTELERLGEGGMGEVLLAHQRSLDREVAIKRPLPAALRDSAALLASEAVVTGSLEHPNIIPVHALGLDRQDRPLIVMKRVVGRCWRESLRQHTDKPSWPANQPEELSRQLQRLSQVCNAVAFAHSRGLLHRDIKPENVMVGDFGETYLVDWGLACRINSDGCRDERLLGTPAYMAPEMAIGEPLDERTDVYLLGATLHEVLTGTPRHAGKTLRQVLSAALRSEPVAYPPNIPAELAQLANQATVADPVDRPQSVEAFQQALDSYEQRRGSNLLCAAADARLAQARKWTGGVEVSGDVQQIYRMLGECRFGYLQALEAWPQNAAARDGLEACLTISVQLELQRRNPAAARAVLAELEQPHSELEAAVTALEREMADQEREQRQLRQLARDVDPGAGFRLQKPLILPSAIMVVLVCGYCLVIGPAGRSLHHLLAAALVLLTIVLTTVIFRRRVLGTTFNRRFIAWLVLAVASIMLNRAAAWQMAVPNDHMFVGDMMIGVVTLGTGAILFFPWIWIGAGLFTGGTILGVLWEGSAMALFSACTVLTFFSAAFFLKRQRWTR